MARGIVGIKIRDLRRSLSAGVQMDEVDKYTSRVNFIVAKYIAWPGILGRNRMKTFVSHYTAVYKKTPH